MFGAGGEYIHDGLAPLLLATKVRPKRTNKTKNMPQNRKEKPQHGSRLQMHFATLNLHRQKVRSDLEVPYKFGNEEEGEEEEEEIGCTGRGRPHKMSGANLET